MAWNLRTPGTNEGRGACVRILKRRARERGGREGRPEWRGTSVPWIQASAGGLAEVSGTRSPGRWGAVAGSGENGCSRHRVSRSPAPDPPVAPPGRSSARRAGDREPEHVYRRAGRRSEKLPTAARLASRRTVGRADRQIP